MNSVLLLDTDYKANTENIERRLAHRFGLIDCRSGVLRSDIRRKIAVVAQGSFQWSQ